MAGYSSDSIAIVDVSDPTAPSRTGGLLLNSVTETSGCGPWGTAYDPANEIIFVACYGTNSLVVLSLAADATNPTYQGKVESTEYLSSPWHATFLPGQDVVFITGQLSSAVAAVDVSDPTNPEILMGLISSTHLSAPVGIAIDAAAKLLVVGRW